MACSLLEDGLETVWKSSEYVLISLAVARFVQALKQREPNWLAE